MTGWIVPGAPTDSTGLNPQQQKQFSSWWLDQQYGGDLSNVAGLTQNENGYWQGEPGRKYDINPETGQRGVYQFLSGSGAPGWLDVTPKKYGTYSYKEWNEDAGEWETVIKTEELSRNRHGLYSPNTTYIQRGPNSLGEHVKYTHNPETGEEGDWIWLGMSGWTNVRPDPNQKSQPVGSPQFDGTTVTQEEYDNYNARNGNSSTPPPTTTTDTTTTTTPPANPTTDSTPPVVPRTGMLRPQQDNWLDVLNRQGASLDSWDPYLGMFTNRQNNIDWSQLGSNQVQSSFEYLAGDGLFPNMNQGRIYAELMRRLGFGG
jgi:hypothetical protein